MTAPLTQEQEAEVRDGWTGCYLKREYPCLSCAGCLLAAALATIDELREEGAALRAEVAWLRKDEARLDALADDGHFDSLNGVDLHDWVYEHVCRPDDVAEVKGLYRAALRAALDAAGTREEVCPGE